MYLAQVPRTPGVHLVGIADLSPDGARANLARVGWKRRADAAPRRSTTRVEDRRHAHRRGLAGAGRASGDRRRRRVHRPPDRRGRALPGGLRARQARRQRHGRGRRVLRPAAGAQGGRGRRRLFARLRRPAGADLRPGRLGAHLRLPGGRRRARPQVAAALQRIDARDGVGLLRPHARAGRARRPQPEDVQQLPRRLQALDRIAPRSPTRPASTVPSNGLLYPPASVEDIPFVTRPISEGGVLERKGMVEVISSLEAERPQDPVRHPHGRVGHGRRPRPSTSSNCFEEYNAHTDPSGRYFTLYKRWHLIGLEVGMSVASVALRGEATGVATCWNADVVATAKRDLKPGEMLDGEGGYTVWGKLLPAETSMRMGGLPLGLAHDVKVVRPVKKGQSLSWADVAMDTSTDGVPDAARDGDAVRRAAAEDRRDRPRLIRDALVFDGSGAAPIARRRRRRAPAASPPSARGSTSHAARTIDADGLALMPGIIDSHTHFDAQITWDPTLAALAGARRDDRGDRQLRLHDRAVPAGRPRAHDAQPDAGRGHVARRAARRASTGASRPFREYLAQLRRTRQRRQRRRLRRPLVGAHLRDGRRRVAARGAPTPRSRRCRRSCATRWRRRGRLRQQHQPGAQRRRRPADAVAPGRRRARWRRSSSAMGEGGRGVYMLTKGGAHAGAVPRIAGRARAAGR